MPPGMRATGMPIPPALVSNTQTSLPNPGEYLRLASTTVPIWSRQSAVIINSEGLLGGLNVFGHNHFSPTQCPASLAGPQHSGYMARAQYWYDQMVGDPESISSAPAHAAPSPTSDLDRLADAVIRGEYGNGEERKRRLGANYAAVQECVNEKFAGKSALRS